MAVIGYPAEDHGHTHEAPSVAAVTKAKNLKKAQLLLLFFFSRKASLLFSSSTRNRFYPFAQQPSRQDVVAVVFSSPVYLP